MSADPIPTADSIANATLLNPLGKVAAISLFVESVPNAKTFYKYVFEVPVLYEDETSCVIQFGNLMDLDAICAALASKGIKLSSGPQLRPWGMKTITFMDPAGHSWEVAQKM